MTKRTVTYTYHIDLDERGLFMAHVENSRGRTVASYDLPTYSDFCDVCNHIESECECDNFTHSAPDWDILDDSWGIMKHKEDVDGLEKHYKECGLMPQSAQLVLVK